MNFIAKLFNRKKFVPGPMTVQDMDCTKSGFPTQYSIKLRDGRMVFANYRYGKLTICISRNITDEVVDACTGELIYYFDGGDEYAGCLHEYSFVNHLGLAGIALPPAHYRDESKF